MNDISGVMRGTYMIEKATMPGSVIDIMNKRCGV